MALETSVFPLKFKYLRLLIGCLLFFFYGEDILLPNLAEDLGTYAGRKKTFISQLKKTFISLP